MRKGQLLFQIDPRPFQVALDTAVAQLRQAEVLASQAQADFDRAERLVATGAVARKTYDDAASARNARQAQVLLRLSWTCPTPASLRPSPGASTACS